MQVFVGGEHETQSVENMTRLVDAGYRYGIPVLGVTAVGKELTRDARYLGLATRICAELGAQIVKTYYVRPRASSRSRPGARCRSSWPAARSCPSCDALEMAYRAIQEGAAGVDMGRNIFQSDAPAAMIQAVARSCTTARDPGEAYELFQELARSAVPA